MYAVARLLLLVGAVGGMYCAALAALFAWPWSGLLIGGAIVARLTRHARRLTTLGSARWADAEDLRRAGMLNASRGLIVGRLAGRRDWVAAVRSLLAPRLSAAEACRAFLDALRGNDLLVRVPQAVHTAVFCPTGGGKGVSCAVPFLLTSDEAAVVVDFKGELARLTADHRRKEFGHKVVLLDPFKVVTATPDTFNPLDFLDRDSPLAIDECNDLAGALVIKTGEEKEPHWNQSAEAWVAALLALVVQHGERDGGTRSLQTVRELLSNPEKLDLAIRAMCESDAWNGMLARLGGQLRHFVDKEKSSTLTTVARHLRFLDTLAVAESTKTSSFDPAALRRGKLTIYLVLPPEHMRSQSPLLRLWIGALLRAVIRGGPQEANKVHFVFDEAASLGHLESIDDAIDKYRGFGVRLQLYFQSLGQLKKCFPDGQEMTLLSNTTQVYMGVQENSTADYVSARLGDQTIVVESTSSGSGSSRQNSYGPTPQDSHGHSDNQNRSWQQQARRLLKPEEVIGLSPRMAITFTPGLPPLLTRLLRYYEEPELGRRPGWFGRFRQACDTLTTATSLCLTTLAVGWFLTVVASGDPRATSPQRESYRRPSLILSEPRPGKSPRR